MEAFWSNNKLDRSITIWWYAAKVLPIVGILMVSILHFLNIDSLLDYILIMITVVFLTSSIVWWWWVMRVVKDFNNIINTSITKFDDIAKEIKELKKEFKNVRNR